jgi:glycosyltransferase involved in cell wall biosynthesis
LVTTFCPKANKTDEFKYNREISGNPTKLADKGSGGNMSNGNDILKKISVVIPTYNENEKILETIKECENSLHGFYHEIIVVDDGSLDGTYQKVQEFAKEHNNLKILHYGDNRGKGFALSYGFKHAIGDIIAFIDADMNIHPRQILTLIREMERTHFDVVVGSKRHPDSKINYPIKRKILSDIYYRFVKILFGIQVKDTQVGLKLYKRKVLEDVCPMVLVKRYAFDIDTLANAQRLGYKIGEAPVEINMNFKTHINTKEIWDMFWDTCAVFYRMKIIFRYENKLEKSKNNKITYQFENRKYTETTSQETFSIDD